MENNRGFSLIEILAVVLIIAILASIVTLAIFGYIKRTKETADSQTAKDIAIAVNAAIAHEELNYETPGLEDGEFFGVFSGSTDSQTGVMKVICRYLGSIPVSKFKENSFAIFLSLNGDNDDETYIKVGYKDQENNNITGNNLLFELNK